MAPVFTCPLFTLRARPRGLLSPRTEILLAGCSGYRSYSVIRRCIQRRLHRKPLVVLYPPYGGFYCPLG